MTASMMALVRRMAAKVSKCPERVLVNSASEHYALCLAWRDRSGSRRYSGRWTKPGWYRLSGFCDGLCDVATVEFAAPHPQGELGIKEETSWTKSYSSATPKTSFQTCATEVAYGSGSDLMG